MIIAHKIALDPNNAQATYFAKAAGVARFAYNWALAEWKRQYEARKQDNSLPKPTEAALRRQLNAIKREQFPWMLEVTKCAPQMAIIQLGKAFQSLASRRGRAVRAIQLTARATWFIIEAHGLAAPSGSTASSAGCEACGEEGAGRARKSAVKPASVKQEVSFEPALGGNE